jgi:hypothetical protein
MSLAKKQAGERAKLKRLLDNLDDRATNWQQLNESVAHYIGWGYGDPTQHFKDALRAYLADE